MTPLSTPASGPPAEILLRRGSVVESRHLVHVAVVDVDGGLRAGLGNLVEPVFFRSAAKLFQALPLVEDGGVEHFGLTPAEIAVTCGSHGGEPGHVAVVSALLAKAGLSAEALRCGPQAPMHLPSATELFRRGITPGRVHNNCSGKHAGMLALARLHGWPLDDYLATDHPVQRRMLTTVAQWTGVAPEGFLLGGDGCGLPTFAAPLPVLALGFARWMAAALGDDLAGADAAPGRILRALREAPEQLAGTGRLCTALMAGGEGRLVVKLGAEGVYGAALLRQGEVLGVALKVPDGAWRAVEVALVHALASLDPSLETLPGLLSPLGSGAGGWRRPVVSDTLGRPAAHLEGSGFTPLELLSPRQERRLPLGLGALVRLAGAQAARDALGVDRELANVAARVMEGTLDSRAVEEAILQSLLFVGYPAALEGMQGWRRVSGTHPDLGADPRGREAWSVQGARLLAQVYGSQAPVVRERMRTMHPDLGTWMVEEGYGKVLSRPGLPVGDRELLNCALLAVQDAPRQLYSHLRGALRVGESIRRVSDVLAEVDPWIPGAEAKKRVEDTWARVQEAWTRHAHAGPNDEGQKNDVC